MPGHEDMIRDAGAFALWDQLFDVSDDARVSATSKYSSKELPG